MLNRQKIRRLREALEAVPESARDQHSLKWSAKYSAKELQHFRDILLKMRNELVDEIQARREAPAGTLFGHSTTLAKGLSAVEAALERIQERRYGVCTSCGMLIEKGRLEAIPYTQLCMQCKEGRSSTRATAGSIM